MSHHVLIVKIQYGQNYPPHAPFRLSVPLSYPVSLCLSHTHTHTKTHISRAALSPEEELAVTIFCVVLQAVERRCVTSIVLRVGRRLCHAVLNRRYN